MLYVCVCVCVSRVYACINHALLGAYMRVHYSCVQDFKATGRLPHVTGHDTLCKCLL